MKNKLLLLFVFIGVNILLGSEQQFAEIGDLVLENGQTLYECKIGFRIIGEMNSEKSNVIIYPTWFGGTSEHVKGLVSEDKLLNPEGFCIVIIDAFGNGISSSPSNSVKQSGDKFPEVTIADMVTAEYKFLTEVLGINHLYGAIGGSMGSFQVFEWLVRYPKFIDRAVVYVCSPRLTSYDLLDKEIQLRMIESGRKYSIPDIEIAAQLNMYNDHVARSPEYYVEHFSREDYFNKRDSYATLSETFILDNKACQIQALLSHDITRNYDNSLKKAARKIKAEMLMIISATDHIVNPQPAIEISQYLNCKLVKLENNCGHLAIGCELERCAAEINQFFRK